MLAFARGGWGSRKLSLNNHFETDADLRRYEALLEMADLVVHHHSMPDLFVAMAERLRQVTAADAANFSLYDPIKNVMRLHLWERSELAPAPLEVPVAESPAGWTWQNQQPLIVPRFDLGPALSSGPEYTSRKGSAVILLVPPDHGAKAFGNTWSRQFSS